MRSPATVLAGVPDRPALTARRVARWVAITGYLLLLALYVRRYGIPFDRSLQAVWILAGITATQVGRPLRHWVRMLADWLPFFAALLAYDYTRGVADTLGRPVLVGGLVDAERWAFFGSVPTTVLQLHFYDPGFVHWYDIVGSLVYSSHFVLPWVLAAVLYVVSRPLWVGLARRIITLSFAGLVTYVLVPAAPPWYAAREGLLPPVNRIASRGFEDLGLRVAGQLLERAQASVNLVAALPSLHAGMALLIAIWAWPLLHSRLARAAVAAYPLAMAVTLVYAGEHYVLDVLAGFLYAAATAAGCTAWERRRSGRRAAQAPDDSPRGVGVDRPHEHA